MNLVPWRNKRCDGEAAGPLARFEDSFENLVDTLWRDPFGAAVPSLLREEFNWGPPLELSESERQITVKIELPGLKPDDIDIRVIGTSLTVSGQKRDERSEKKGSCQYSERRFGQFARRISLPAEVDAERVDATYRDGLLTIVLEKAPGAKSHRVKIKAGLTQDAGKH